MVENVDMSRPLTLTIATAAAALLAACGGSGTAETVSSGGTQQLFGEAIAFDPSSSFMAEAGERTAQVDTYHFAADMEMSFTGLPDMQMEMTGQVDLATNRASMVFDMGAMFEAIASIDDTFPTELSEAMFGDGTFEMVMADTTIYMRFPLLTQGLGIDAEWIGLDIAEMTDLSALSGSMGMSGGMNDPTAILEFLQGVSSVEEVGVEDVRGVRTTRVHADVDISVLYDGLDLAAQAELDAMFGIVGFASVPIDVWVDDNGIVRRIAVEVGASGEFDAGFGAGEFGSSFDASVALTMDLFDFNGPVSITVPNPADVADFGTLFEDMFGGSGFNF